MQNSFTYIAFGRKTPSCRGARNNAFKDHGSNGRFQKGIRRVEVVILTQKSRDVASSLVCTGIGILFCIGSVKYGDIRARFPSAGFFPFMNGIILVFLALFQLIGVFTARKSQRGQRRRFFPAAG